MKASVNSMVREKMKKYIILLIIAFIGAIGAYWLLRQGPSVIPKKSASSIISSLQKTKDIDRLYTGAYLIPVIDLQRGHLKRDDYHPLRLAKKAMSFFDEKPSATEDAAKDVVKGCCYKKYEVAVGYDNLMRILENEEYVEAACKGDMRTLPAPSILAVNCRSTESQGKYDSGGACYGWDSDDATRKRIIQQAMKEEEILDKVISRGKESLKNFLSAFCSRG